MRPSTAVGVANLRAHHSKYDEPRIFDDTLATRLIAPAEREFFDRRNLDALRKLRPDIDVETLDPASRVRELPRVRGALALAVVRARVTEDWLTEATENNCRQYAILGAGFDTFAYRRSDLSNRLAVFEIDHPAGQELKRARVAAAGLPCPEDLHYLAVDFERESVCKVLIGSTYRRHRKAFFAWLGVSYYLSYIAIDKTLCSISRIAAPGSRLAFDYIDSDAFHPHMGSTRVREMMEFVQELGEPMITGWDPRSLAELLASHGFRIIEALDPRRLQARYFAGRADGLCATEHFHMILVEVA